MNKYLIKLADHLDKKGLHKEADYVDWIIKESFNPAKLIEKPLNQLGEMQTQHIYKSHFGREFAKIHQEWLDKVGEDAYKTKSFSDEPKFMDWLKKSQDKIKSEKAFFGLGPKTFGKDYEKSMMYLNEMMRKIVNKQLEDRKK